MQQAQFDLHARIERDHWWFTGRRRILIRVLEEVVPPSSGRLVVDVGCGTGGNIAALAGTYRAVGIDPSGPGIELAGRAFPDVDFRCGVSPGDLGPLAGEADAVLLMDVLEHVADDRGLLRAHVEAMRPGAIVLISVPASRRLWSQHDESFGHYRRYDERMLREVWSGLPVRPRLVSYFNTRLFPIVWLVRKLSRIRGKALGAAGTDLSMPPAPLNRILSNVFAGEARRLLETLRDPQRSGYRYGVSLMAVLERVPGASPTRPAQEAPDSPSR
ncbi:class I SAM-dependent methyltransferase [bacterium]|nr:class I SAM-dependent methyltransferase [bacterium]